MALTYTGVSAPMPGLGGTSYQATDDQGNTVAVQASAEAIQDHGLAAVQQKAREKYAAGNYTQGNVCVVTVKNADF